MYFPLTQGRVEAAGPLGAGIDAIGSSTRRSLSVLIADAGGRIAEIEAGEPSPLLERVLH